MVGPTGTFPNLNEDLLHEQQFLSVHFFLNHPSNFSVQTPNGSMNQTLPAKQASKHGALTQKHYFFHSSIPFSPFFLLILLFLQNLTRNLFLIPVFELYSPQTHLPMGLSHRRFHPKPSIRRRHTLLQETAPLILQTPHLQFPSPYQVLLHRRSSQRGFQPSWFHFKIWVSEFQIGRQVAGVDVCEIR